MLAYIREKNSLQDLVYTQKTQFFHRFDVESILMRDVFLSYLDFTKPWQFASYKTCDVSLQMNSETVGIGKKDECVCTSKNF